MSARHDPGASEGTRTPRPARDGATHHARPRQRGQGNLIRKLRIAAGLTQAELVARLDPPISIATLASRERCDPSRLKRRDYDALIAAIAAAIP